MKTSKRDKQEAAVRRKLSSLHGSEFDGRRCVISFKTQDGSLHGYLYLCGHPYLFTCFAERAYEMGENTARDLIARYPLFFERAEILVRGRR